MQLISDFHIHSRFSRACSGQLTLPNLEVWAKVKGIDLMGTGDFTHPVWLSEIRNQLSEIRDGIYQLKSEYAVDLPYAIPKLQSTYFIPTSEIATIWSQDGKLRRMHTILIAPDLNCAVKLTNTLRPLAKLGADGRPIIGMSARELAAKALEIDERFLIIPAHAWTPWFAVFGSQSGFDSLEKCFGDLTPYIYAIETGMSSSPTMNWQVSALDKVALISCSDGHSLNNLGREATVFHINNDLSNLSFDLIAQMIKEGAPKWRQDFVSGRTPSRSLSATLKVSPTQIVNDRAWPDNYLDYTIEFFPEEGKYHHDGHRSCGINWDPETSKKFNNLCPNCGQKVTIGVLSRTNDLADRPYGYKPARSPGFKSIVPIRDILSGLLGIGKMTKKIDKIYQNLVNNLGPEFNILLEQSLESIAEHSSPELAGIIGQMRSGDITMTPGYDGVYGKLNLPISKTVPQQSSLFNVNINSR